MTQVSDYQIAFFCYEKTKEIIVTVPGEPGEKVVHSMVALEKQSD